MGSVQPHVQWIGAVCLGLKRPRREVDHSPPLNVLAINYVLYFYYLQVLVSILPELFSCRKCKKPPVQPNMNLHTA